MVIIGSSYLLQSHRRRGRVDEEYNVLSIPNDAIYSNNLSDKPTEPGKMMSVVFGAIFGGVIFGGLHCLVWNFHFLTPIGVLRWRICSVATTSLPIIALVPMTNYVHASNGQNWYMSDAKRRRIIGQLLVALFILPYLLARPSILIEIFKGSLISCPGGFQ